MLALPPNPRLEMAHLAGIIPASPGFYAHSLQQAPAAGPEVFLTEVTRDEAVK
jgi:hypothetical protein